MLDQLTKGPKTFEQLWQAIGADNKKAIRSHVDKRIADGRYVRTDEGQYALKPEKAAKPVSKKTVKAKPAAAKVIKEKAENKKPPLPAEEKKGPEQTELAV